MDAFTTLTVFFTTPQFEESSPIASVPTDEESSSSSGGSYCVVA